ncbi:MAG: BolA family transcriptional regulator [Candidatus Protistobacter heckmanni]|nr:BolA family transcriptional regulator [Candidatus Protistobacter heckmanni]
MALHPDRIADLLRQELAPTRVQVEDEGALHVGHAGQGSGHFRVRIVASCFAGQPRLARHRMVYDALQPLMGAGIHALAIHAQSPAEAGGEH